jgi:hypothetical protein
MSSSAGLPRQSAFSTAASAASRHVGPQHEHLTAERQPELERDRLRRLVHQPLQHPQHPQAALDRCRGRIVHAVAVELDHVGGHGADRAQGDRVLTEGGQHPLDVVHEDPAGSDDQDAAGLEAAPVGVQQVRGPVQGHHRLAGAGTARDHRDALVRGTDGLVLLGLDRGHDVAHGVPAGPGQGRHQRTFADHHELVVGALAVEQVVLDPDHPVALAAQHPTPDHRHRVGRGGAVERLSGAGPPVDHQRLVVGVTDPDPAHVADLPVGAVQPTEHQTLVLGVQHREAARRLEREDVPLVQPGPVLLPDEVGPVGLEQGPTGGGHVLRLPGGLRQPCVDQVDVALLDGDLPIEGTG